VGEKVYRRKKFCYLCSKKYDKIDYKDLDLLRRFISERGKILNRKQSGTCAVHQRKLAQAIRRSRFIGFLPAATSS
jgi:small subunit ribosomal protein S18